MVSAEFIYFSPDKLMVGQLGSTAVAAVEVAGRPAFIYSVVAGAQSVNRVTCGLMT